MNNEIIIHHTNTTRTSHLGLRSAQLIRSPDPSPTSSHIINQLPLQPASQAMSTPHTDPDFHQHLAVLKGYSPSDVSLSHKHTPARLDVYSMYTSPLLYSTLLYSTVYLISIYIEKQK